MTTFKELPLFPGPHRFRAHAQGHLLDSDLAETPPSPGSSSLGLLEERITITGRLIASSESALWEQRDAITAQLLDPPTPGTLIDPHGRAHEDMSFIRFTPASHTDRGRTRSLAYTAEFIRFHQMQ